MGRGLERLRRHAPKPASRSSGLPRLGRRLHPRGRPDRRGRHARLEGQLPPQERRLLHGAPGAARGMAGALGLPPRLPASRRKFEWQAQDASRWTRRSCTCGRRPPREARHLRSGAGRDHPDEHPRRPAAPALPPRGCPTPGPARVVRLRRPAGRGHLQAVGNGVNVGAAYHVFREHVLAHIAAVCKRRPAWLDAVQIAASSPDRCDRAHRGRLTFARIVTGSSRVVARGRGGLASMGAENWVSTTRPPPRRPQEEGHCARSRSAQGAARRGCTLPPPPPARQGLYARHRSSGAPLRDLRRWVLLARVSWSRPQDAVHRPQRRAVGARWTRNASVTGVRRRWPRSWLAGHARLGVRCARDAGQVAKQDPPRAADQRTT